MLWVGRTRLLSVVCLGHGAEAALVGGPDGRLYLVPQNVLVSAATTRLPIGRLPLFLWGNDAPYRLGTPTERLSVRSRGKAALARGGSPPLGRIRGSLGLPRQTLSVRHVPRRSQNVRRPIPANGRREGAPADMWRDRRAVLGVKTDGTPRIDVARSGSVHFGASPPLRQPSEWLLG